MYNWKIWHYGQNYGTMVKTMDYIEKTIDSIPKTMELWFTIEKLWYYGKKTMVL